VRRLTPCLGKELNRFKQRPVRWLARLKGLNQELEELDAEETIATLQRTHS
jgi:hypothetical protein